MNLALFSARQWYVPLSEAEASLMTSSLRVSPPSAETRSLRVMRWLAEGSAGRLWYGDCDGCSDSGWGQLWKAKLNSGLKFHIALSGLLKKMQLISQTSNIC